MEAMEVSALQDRESEVENIRARGRILYRFVGISVALLFCISLYSSIWAVKNGIESPGLPVIGGMVVWVWALNGGRVIRWVLRGIIAVNVVVVLFGISKFWETRSAAYNLVELYPAILVPLILAASFVVLFFRSVNLYLDDRYNPHLDGGRA